MRNLIMVLFMMITFALLSIQNDKDSKIMITRLEKAEKIKNIKMIEELFANNASIVFPDSPPKYSKEAIISFYKYLWENTPIETVEYKNITVEQIKTQKIETGTFVLLNGNKEKVELPFKAIFVMKENEYKLQLLTLGEGVSLENITPKLLKSTGEYKVGQSTHYYPKQEQENNRTIAFQIWYPANPAVSETAVYHSKAVAKASAEFLKLPIFFNSYAPLVKTNSYKNASLISGKKFPILLYNHGYGGFTSVYQSVFEELASYGYIVISIAHENESSLFIAKNGNVIANNPENEFYKKRALELNGSEINKLQDIILNSDNIEENRDAYVELIKLSPLHNESTRLWAIDTKSVIEKLKELHKENHIIKGIFDFEKIGIFGHSVGGATAGQMAFNSEEIKAGINLDGFQFGDLIHHKLKIPFMFVSSNQRGNSYLRASSFIDNSDTDCYQAVITGFSHSSFTDLRLFEPDGEEAISLQRELTLSFFDRYLKNQDVELNEISNKYNQLKFINFSPSQQNDKNMTKSQRVELFEKVWNNVNEHFFDRNFNGVDWQKKHIQYKTKIENCNNTGSLFLILNKMLFELNSSHCGVGLLSELENVVSPYIFKKGEVGLDIRIIENQIIATNVTGNSPAEKAKIKRGFIINKIGDLSLEDIEKRVKYKPPFNHRNKKFHLTSEVLRHIYGESGTTVKIDFFDENNKLHQVNLERTKRQNGVSIAEGMPEAYIKSDNYFISENIAYITFNAFQPSCMNQILSHLDLLSQAKGLIIDLRGNDGGSIESMKLFFGRFVSERRKYGTYINRNERNEDFIEPIGRKFEGEIVVLVDEMSISAAENTAGIVQQFKIGKIIGTQTPGQMLWGNGYLINESIALAIPIYKLEYPDGYNPENSGIIPDIEIKLNRFDLLKGKDSQLEKAIEYLKSIQN